MYADKNLLEPLGFGAHSWMFRDAMGVYYGGYGLRLRARDMAKFGRLYLQKGASNGTQRYAAKWVEESTRDQTRHQYGYLWWSNFPEVTYHRLQRYRHQGAVHQRHSRPAQRCGDDAVPPQ